MNGPENGSLPSDANLTTDSRLLPYNERPENDPCFYLISKSFPDWHAKPL